MAMKKGLLTLAAGTAGVTGIELFNRAVTLDPSELEGQLPVDPLMWQWRLGKVAVYESGNPANPPILLLHGQNAAASAHEMEEPFARLSENYHVFAPDLLGYGLSDRPDIDYTPELYIDLITDLLREVVKQPATVIALSLTSAYAIEVAALNPEWVANLVLVCPTGLRRLTTQSSRGKVVEGILKTPVIGQSLFNGIASKAGIRGFLKSQTYYDKSLVTDELVEMNYRTAHVPGARFAPAAFVSGKLYHDASEAWTRLKQPILLVWGREATITPISDAAIFLATNPHAALEEISPAGIVPQDEQPEQFVRAVVKWLER
ncbi:MAG: alpha/beta fold hydrolase [Chloroflexota bacterium]